MTVPFRKPPGLELITPPPGLEQVLPSPATKMDREAVPKTIDLDALSSCSTADTAEALEWLLDSPAWLLDSPAYIKGGICAIEGSATYGPGRLLRRTATPEEVPPPPPPPPVAIELETCIERSGAALLLNPGSAGHACGLCQPCEFFHRGRCTAGVDCKFCHLCGPDAAKARRRAKKAVMRSMGQMLSQQQQSLSGEW
jgi:hypothetical protein